MERKLNAVHIKHLRELVAAGRQYDTDVGMGVDELEALLDDLAAAENDANRARNWARTWKQVAKAERVDLLAD